VFSIRSTAAPEISVWRQFCPDVETELTMQQRVNVNLCVKLQVKKLRGLSPLANYAERPPLVDEDSANILRI
jgi:hypothetical protein